MDAVILCDRAGLFWTLHRSHSEIVEPGSHEWLPYGWLIRMVFVRHKKSGPGSASCLDLMYQA